MTENLQKMILDAFEGFVKSISLGGLEFTETLQDSLKLFGLWFKYGDLPIIQNSMKQHYEDIDITCWLNVVPQLIAKLDIENEIIQNNVMDLLEYIGTHYPQGTIFQLLLNAQSKKERRQKSALKLIERMQQQRYEFVMQAITITIELQRVAILQQEEWQATMLTLGQTFSMMPSTISEKATTRWSFRSCQISIRKQKMIQRVTTKFCFTRSTGIKSRRLATTSSST